MSRILWTEAAITDLHAIADYLNETAGAAVRQTVLDRLILAASWLVDHPRAGAPLDAGVRKWRPRRTHYLLLYLPVDDGIRIVRVHHDRTDWRATSV